MLSPKQGRTTKKCKPHTLKIKNIENVYWQYSSLAFWQSKGSTPWSDIFLLYFITDAFVNVGYCFGFARHT